MTPDGPFRISVRLRIDPFAYRRSSSTTPGATFGTGGSPSAANPRAAAAVAVKITAAAAIRRIGTRMLMEVARFMVTISVPPRRDTVLYDGACRFCIGQVGLLRRFDLGRRFDFRSCHEHSVATDFPELSRDELLSQMYVVDTAGGARGGADAVRYLSRKLPPLWPLALLLHIPGTMPLWASCYRFIARNRYRIAGTANDCDSGTCKLP